MILSRLSDFMREHRRASLNDLANGLGATTEALEPMLETLQRQGVHALKPADGNDVEDSQRLPA